MTYVLAIDQSTSATKAILFDSAGRLVDSDSREHRQFYPQPQWVEHDAEEIWKNTLETIHQIATRCADKLPATIGLAITNQRETIVIFDRQSGRPLSNAIVWQCRRGAPACHALSAAGHDDLVHRKTGLKLDTYFSAPKLKWLAAARPDLHEQLANGTALIGTIDAYLIYRLTKGSVFATDSTNASRTLLYDAARLCWDNQLCALFDVPRECLPQVRDSVSRFGETDAAGNLPTKLPICGVMGDSQASLFALCGHEPGVGKATFGSGTSVLVNVGHRFDPNTDQSITALAWTQNGRPTYAVEGLINYSSATITWLRDQLRLIDDATDTEALATAVNDNAGVYLVPAFAGLSAPYWRADARAAIVGMTSATTKEHIVRAALESIAYQIRDVLEMIRSQNGIDLSVLYADGGPTRNRFLMQFTADITGLELRVADVAESSARGAAMAALLGLGKVDSRRQFAALPGEFRSYQPTMPAETVERLYSGWRNAVRRLL